jgi:hypothetical protein
LFEENSLRIECKSPGEMKLFSVKKDIDFGFGMKLHLEKLRLKLFSEKEDLKSLFREYFKSSGLGNLNE